jgi:transposase
MARAYSSDLRTRAIGCVEGGMTRRGVARLLRVSASSAVRWMARFTATGERTAKPRGGESRSPLAPHGEWLLRLVAEEPDLTLGEIRGRLRERGVEVAVSSIWRFYDRHGISFKKNGARRRAGAPRRRRGTRRVAWQTRLA